MSDFGRRFSDAIAEDINKHLILQKEFAAYKRELNELSGDEILRHIALQLYEIKKELKNAK